MANPEHVRIVKQGAGAIRAWRMQHLAGRFDLSGANLSGANLSFADLSAVNLGGADMRAVDLAGAYLCGANLKGANLAGAYLGVTNLSWANLTAANLAETRCILTVFAGVDLSQTRGLDAVKHEGPSTIGIDTILKSKGQIPEAFLRGCGVPESLIKALPQILAEVQYYSCFIAYGEPDKDFAERLYEKLFGRGITCWTYALDSTPGRRTWQEITERRRTAERMIVLCSARALVRDGMLKEIEEQIDEDPDKIIPISLDNLWTEPGFIVKRGARDLKPFLVERNWANFADNNNFDQALGRLLRGLESAPSRPHRPSWVPQPTGS